jgi:hypothetical protein
MTEDQWAEAEEDALWPVIMRLGAGRHRLLAVALVRSLIHFANNPATRAALEVAERFADTGKTKAAMKRARDALSDARVSLFETHGRTQDRAILGAYATMHVATVACSERGAAGAVRETVLAWREAEGIPKSVARRRVYPIFREVAGPDTPVAFSPSWRTDTALSLARQMYDSRDFSAMPILADALQDAGCDSEDILSHCRGDGPHVRGCWVVDLVLGKG